MSTALLSTPGKVHELCDDLESHFFVVLYSSLHFLKHGRPSRLNMKFIFDHAFISPVTETHVGGEGKESMHNKGLKVKFKSEPLTSFIRALLTLLGLSITITTATMGGKNPPRPWSRMSIN